MEGAQVTSPSRKISVKDATRIYERGMAHKRKIELMREKASKGQVYISPLLDPLVRDTSKMQIKMTSDKNTSISRIQPRSRLRSSTPAANRKTRNGPNDTVFFKIRNTIKSPATVTASLEQDQLYTYTPQSGFRINGLDRVKRTEGDDQEGNREDDDRNDTLENLISEETASSRQKPPSPIPYTIVISDTEKKDSISINRMTMKYSEPSILSHDTSLQTSLSSIESSSQNAGLSSLLSLSSASSFSQVPSFHQHPTYQAISLPIRQNPLSHASSIRKKRNLKEQQLRNAIQNLAISARAQKRKVTKKSPITLHKKDSDNTAMIRQINISLTQQIIKKDNIIQQQTKIIKELVDQLEETLSHHSKQLETSTHVCDELTKSTVNEHYDYLNDFFHYNNEEEFELPSYSSGHCYNTPQSSTMTMLTVFDIGV